MYPSDPTQAGLGLCDLDIPNGYDLSLRARGMYAQYPADGSQVVIPDPDRIVVVLDPESSNQALRVMAEIIHQQPELQLGVANSSKQTRGG